MKATRHLFSRLLTALLLSLAAAPVLTSCQAEDSENVNQDRIYTEYSLVYDRAEDKTYARAAFKFGNAAGTALQLTGPATVTVDGDALAFVPLLNYYEKQYAGQRAQATFTYKDVAGTSFVNTVSGLLPAEFPTSFTNLSKTSAYTLTWDGQPLRTPEILDVILDGPGQSDPLQYFQTTVPGATSLILEANKISQVLSGEGKAFMNRTQILPLQQGSSAGGSRIGRYQALPRTVQIQ
ncbi:hypothetical protein [Hymenobacter weizhouensis]|uniref:hypothetical protein n=1 Tax=Hymenobacter sp. YIM 151500-1 TaxID=2987689 RepID=UPI002227F6BE|nr:hypothetical protein [Hymenobacter sp. YIM 151500-1]UYZ64784.1 hypothetical protein OIS53_08025 [Hymenobacter sp. YIM 151500-1]